MLAPAQHPRNEFIFGDKRPFAQCHASTIVAGVDQSLLAAWFGGTRESHSDVAIWAANRSSASTTSKSPADPAAPWNEPRQIAKINNEPHWNPVLFALSEDGQNLVLHFKVGERIRHWTTWSQRSHDGGVTWSEPAPLVPNDRGGRGAVRNKPIRLHSGDWLAGASLERWRRWDAFFDRSPDGLDGWEATPLVKTDGRRLKGKGLIQPTLWESKPGYVHALFRSTDGRVHRSDSEDDGRSWSRTRAIEVPNNNSSLDLARLPDGTLALACNPVQGNWAARTPLSILFSRDNGKTFPKRIDIETAPGEFSYPALIAIGEELALTYTWNRRRIAYRRVSKNQISDALA